MSSTDESFNKVYGDMDDNEMENMSYRRKMRKRLIIIGVSSVVLVAMVISVIVGTLVHTDKTESNSDPGRGLAPSASLESVCSVTNYPKSCVSSISRVDNSSSSDPVEIFKFSLLVSLGALVEFANYTDLVMVTQVVNETHLEQAGFKVCRTLLRDGINRLNDSIATMNGQDGNVLTYQKVNDLRTWLSTAITDQETCIDTLEELNSTHLEDMKFARQNSTEYSSNSLAIVTRFLSLLVDFKVPIHGRRLLWCAGRDGSSKFPTWVRPADRRLLQQPTNPTPNLIVAQDGSGNFLTIGEAVAMTPSNSRSRFVIYVKAGVYEENVVVDKKNVMIYGDGMYDTIVTNNFSFADGIPIYATATFAATGDGFIARDIGFRNSAGPANSQAVAFLLQSDFSVIYRCMFDAYQDTLYANTNRQFFRECDISGTVDFIFGNAAVVFQNCNILPKQPLPGQYNTITAQGKSDVNQNTGISIQKSTLSVNSNGTFDTYLGRPWKDYSTTVFMESYIGSFLDPKGWIGWNPDVIPPKTIFYGEYQNVGPGSSTSYRVTWLGYMPTLTTDRARKFTVDVFLNGTGWISQSGVTFDPSL